MPAISMKELLEAGVHFGHQTKRWNPKDERIASLANVTVFAIIDLQEDAEALQRQQYRGMALVEMAALGKTVLFVGTTRHAQEAVAEEAKRCEMYYVNQRWLGGLLTNMTTVQKSIKRLKELEQMAAEGAYGRASAKKEIGRLERDRKHLDLNLSGIKDMPGLPDVIFVIDSNKEAIAVKEARRLGIPVVAIVDTNCDPDEVDWVIWRATTMQCCGRFASSTSKIADAVIEGRALASEQDFTAEKVVADGAAADETGTEDISEEYSQYVDPKYAEQIMQESMMLDDTSSSEAAKARPPETERNPAAAATESTTRFDRLNRV